MFNTRLQKFEVHYKRNSSTLELVLPYEKLDKRTIDLVLKSRVENKQKLIKEMDENNKKLEEQQNKKMFDEASYKTKEMMTYLDSKGDASNINFNDSYKTKWI